MLSENEKAPDFSLPATGGETASLDDYKGKKLVLYFYPKDDTPGCTKQACNLNENLKYLEALDAEILGVSKCSIEKHEKFKAKYSLGFPLASDKGSDVCERYGVWKEKSMYGKKYMGIERSTFLIDEKGNIEKVWRNVKVGEHLDEILNALKK